jgi:hypothetical protein
VRTPGDPDEENYGLGKAIRPKAPEPTEDEFERFTGQHGDRLMRNKRTGAIQNAVPKKLTDAEIEAIRKVREQQEEDGYPNVYWGTY